MAKKRVRQKKTTETQTDCTYLYKESDTPLFFTPKPMHILTTEYSKAVHLVNKIHFHLNQKLGRDHGTNSDKAFLFPAQPNYETIMIKIQENSRGRRSSARSTSTCRPYSAGSNRSEDGEVPPRRRALSAASAKGVRSDNRGDGFNRTDTKRYVQGETTKKPTTTRTPIKSPASTGPEQKSNNSVQQCRTKPINPERKTRPYSTHSSQNSAESRYANRQQAKSGSATPERRTEPPTAKPKPQSACFYQSRSRRVPIESKTVSGSTTPKTPSRPTTPLQKSTSGPNVAAEEAKAAPPIPKPRLRPSTPVQRLDSRSNSGVEETKSAPPIPKPRSRAPLSLQRTDSRPNSAAEESRAAPPSARPRSRPTTPLRGSSSQMSAHVDGSKPSSVTPRTKRTYTIPPAEVKSTDSRPQTRPSTPVQKSILKSSASVEDPKTTTARSVPESRYSKSAIGINDAERSKISERRTPPAHKSILKLPTTPTSPASVEESNVIPSRRIEQNTSSKLVTFVDAFETISEIPTSQSNPTTPQPVQKSILKTSARKQEPKDASNPTITTHQLQTTTILLERKETTVDQSKPVWVTNLKQEQKNPLSQDVSRSSIESYPRLPVPSEDQLLLDDVNIETISLDPESDDSGPIMCDKEFEEYKQRSTNSPPAKSRGLKKRESTGFSDSSSEIDEQIT